MITRKVEREAWERYFGSLSNVLHDHPRNVTLEVLSPTLGEEVVAEHSPLRAIIWEPKGSEKGDIDIEVGDDTGGERLVHHIDNACVVWVEENDRGEPVAIDIEGQDENNREAVKAIIRFED